MTALPESGAKLTGDARVIHPGDPDHPGEQVKRAGVKRAGGDGPEDKLAAAYERGWHAGWKARDEAVEAPKPPYDEG